MSLPTRERVHHRAFCRHVQKACLTVEENNRLKSRLEAVEAEVGQRQASSAEQDYEEVIQLLEAEIKDLKNQLASKRQARAVEASKVSLLFSTSDVLHVRRKYSTCYHATII